MKADELKQAGLRWLRFDRQMTHVATEVGEFCADVLGATAEKVVEIETKVSAGDLRADFAKPKHEVYADPSKKREYQVWGSTYRYWGVPNAFFFMVPTRLVDLAIKLCEEKGPRYGVIVYDPTAECFDAQLRVIRRAKKLHTDPPDARLMESLVKRMSSELVGLYHLKVNLEIGVEKVLAAHREKLPPGQDPIEEV